MQSLVRIPTLVVMVLFIVFLFKGLDLMVVYPKKIAVAKKHPWKRNFFTQILNFFSSCEVHINFFFKIVNTLCYNNDDDYNLFKL
jgi:hypothetical protein